MTPPIDLTGTIERVFRPSESAWSVAQAEWQDQKAHQFEQAYWSEIENGGRTLGQLFSELEQLIEDSRRVQ